MSDGAERNDWCVYSAGGDDRGRSGAHRGPDGSAVLAK